MCLNDRNLKSKNFKLLAWVKKKLLKKNPTGGKKYPLSPCAVGLTKNADPDRYSCSGYGIGSDSCSSKSLGLKMLLFLEETIVYQSLLITRKKIGSWWWYLDNSRSTIFY